MSQQEKQEGEFKVKARKPSMKKMLSENEPIKVNFPPIGEEPIKVVIPKETPDAVQEQSPNEGVLRTEQPAVELPKVEQGNEGSFENVIQEISEEEIKEETKEVAKELEYHAAEQINTGKALPENIEKLVSFMEETGGTVEDYVRLNADYSNVNNNTLLKEYYKSTKPHLDNEEIDFLLEDRFYYDEDIDEEREIKLKKLAFKEEVSKAKKYLDDTKAKYYAEIKSRPTINNEQQKATDFFNRYNNEQNKVAQQQEMFKKQTSNLFSNEFKGFEFNLGEKKFRYNVQNPTQVAETQSNIQSFVGKFLDKEGNVTDAPGYHKALYTAMNSDKIASHFYEQGKADAVKEVITNSKNPSVGVPRQASNTFVGGLKIKSVSGWDSAKLKIQTKKF
jgi:hypothetical protein